MSDRILTSPVLPGGKGWLSQRISLHYTGQCHMPLATHIEAQQENGQWARLHGYYFSGEEKREAIENYMNRCLQLGVQPLEV